MTKVAKGYRFDKSLNQWVPDVRDAREGEEIGKYWNEDSGYWVLVKEGDKLPEGVDFVLDYDPDAKPEEKEGPITDRPETWFYGLSKSVVSDVDEVCEHLIRSSFSFIRETAQSLVQIKSMIPQGNWIAFCESEALPFSARHCFDLVAAWTWLEDTRVEDEVLGRLSVRTMAKLGIYKSTTKNIALFNQIEKEYLLEGIAISENQLKIEERRFKGTIAPVKKTREKLEDVISDREHYKRRFKQAVDAADELEEENRQLKALILEFETQMLKDGYNDLLNVDSYRKIKKTMGEVDQMVLMD